jgi:ABC-type uncharacterized transport system permease subunit
VNPGRFRLLTGVVVGSIIYRGLLTSIYLLGIPPVDFKLITAALVLGALGLPTLWTRWRSQMTRKRGARARLRRAEER